MSAYLSLKIKYLLNVFKTPTLFKINKQNSRKQGPFRVPRFSRDSGFSPQSRITRNRVSGHQICCRFICNCKSCFVSLRLSAELVAYSGRFLSTPREMGWTAAPRSKVNESFSDKQGLWCHDRLPCCSFLISPHHKSLTIMFAFTYQQQSKIIAKR